MRRKAIAGVAPLLALAVVIAIGAVLRFAALSQRGLIYWDEGKFALEGLRLYSLLHSSAVPGSPLQVGKAVGTAKPTHALLISVSYALFGVHDYAALYLNAAAGVAGVALLYFIAVPWIGAQAALLASLLFAVSDYEIVYARSALSESDGNVFLLSGVALLAADFGKGEGGWKRSLAAGLLIGIGLTVNYRLVVYAGALALAYAVACWRRLGEGRALRALGGLGVGCAVVPVLWQAVDVAARAHGLVLFRNELTGQPSSYVQELIYQLHQGKQARLHFAPLIYVQWYLARQGWLSLVLLLLGVVVSVMRRRPSLVVPAALVLGPYVIYVFAPFYVPRNLDAALPFTAILCAVALAQLWRWSSRPVLRVGLRTLAVAAALVVVGAQLAAGWQLTEVRSGFRAAADFVEHNGGRAFTSTEVEAFYLRSARRPCAAVAMYGGLRRLDALSHQGYRYALLDNHHTSVLTAYLRSHGKPMARYFALGPRYDGENLIASENSHPARNDAQAEFVDVYDLSGLPLPAPARRVGVSCDVNRVI